MSLPDYKVKSFLLTDHPEWIQAVRNLRRYDYLQTKRFDHDLKPVRSVENRMKQLENDVEITNVLIDSAPSLFLECNKIVDADKQRKKRLRKRIERIMSKGKAYFITLTFNDETLMNTDEKTRRTYATRLLKSISPDFVGNIDFGKQNGREHYHFVAYSTLLDDIKYRFTKKYGWICSDAVPLAEWSKYGFYSIKSCGSDKVDQQKLSWYISKLTNHAIKETTKRSALIFSR